MSEFTRFDIPDTVTDMLNKAIELDIIDGADIYAMVFQHATNWEKVINEVVEIAYSSIHSGGGDNHKEVVAIAETFWRDNL